MCSLTFAVLLLLPGLSAAEAPQRVSDLLDRPAAVSRRAAQAVSLAVARAGDRLVAVGELGTVLLSDDDGLSWQQARSVPVSVALTGVQFVSAELGWAIGHGGVVLHTRDGGQSWQRQLDGWQIAELAGVEAAARAAAGEDASQLQLNAQRLSADGPDKPLLGLYFADADRGWVVGAYGLALMTGDGGAHWQARMGSIPNRLGLHLNAVAPTANGLVIAGEQGKVFLSSDGGEQFTRLESDYPGSYFGALAMGDDLLAFGLRGNAWRYTAAGDEATAGRWSPVELGQAATLTAGLRLANGDYLLVDESAQLFLGRRGSDQAVSLAQASVAGVSGIAPTADGAYILATLQGPYRLDPAVIASTTGGRP